MPQATGSSFFRYGIVPLAVAAAMLLRWLLWPVLGNELAFLFLWPVVMVCAWNGGLWPGLLATLLSALAAAFFLLEPRFSFAVTRPADLVGVAVFVVLGGFISVLSEKLHRGRRLAERQAEEVVRQRERLRVSLTSIGDAVISVDTQGRVDFVNPTAEALTGWTHAEALGQPLESIFPIINEETRQPVEHPVARVMREGVVVGLANHTVLVAKDGTERSIEDSAAPIKADDGRIVGVILVFHDVTEKRRVEKRLREKAKLLDLANVLVRDLEDHIIRWNAGAERLYGWTKEEAEGRVSHDLLRTQFPEPLEEIESRLWRDGQWEGELTQTRRDGRTVVVASQWVLHRDGEGKPAAILEVNNNITAQKGAETALRESEERFRLLVECGTDHAIIFLDPQGRVATWNAGAERLLGYHDAEIVGQPFARLFIPEDRERGDPERELQTATATGRAGDDRWHVRKDGSRLWVNGVTVALRDRAGSLRGFAKVMQDRTEQRRAQEEQDRFFAVGADMLVVASFEGHFEWVSPSWERTFGWRPEEMTARPWLEFVHPDDREATVAEAEKLFAGQETFSFVNRYRCKDGSYRWISWKARPFPEERRLYCGGTDITEHRRLEEQFHQSQKMEAFGQLAGGVAHDFNNLLTVISGFSEMLLGQLPPGDPTRDPIKEIQKAGERAAHLTRQLLAFSRKQIIAPKVLDLNAVVADAEKMLARLIGEDVALTTALAPALGRVKADAGQLEQVIVNLAVNARDAMPQGGRLTIETANVELGEDALRGRPDLRPGRYVLLAASDTGCGMDEATQARIFEPFFTTKEVGKGTGLGLATVYGIVKQSGGHVAVYSEPGRGTTFKVYLPLVEEPVSSGKLHPGLKTTPHGTETVLVAEDEHAVRTLTRYALQMYGYTVLEASSGDEAIRVGEQHRGPIHLLLSDVVMPGMGGRQVAERLARLQPGMKVLYLSGYTDDAVVRHGVLETDTAFLQKPFTLDALARKVREVLDDKASGRGEVG